MQDASIIVQIVSSSILAFTSIVMLVVSGLLGWNARRMRLIGDESNRISMWQLRYDSFKSLGMQRDNLFHAVQKYDSISDPLGLIESIDWQSVEVMCNRGILLFHSEKEVKDYLDELYRRGQEIFWYSKSSTMNRKEVAEKIRYLSEWMYKNDNDALMGMVEYLKS